MDSLVGDLLGLLVSVEVDGPSFSHMDYVLLLLEVCFVGKDEAGMSVGMLVVV